MLEHIEGYDRWLDPPKEKEHHPMCDWHFFQDDLDCDCDALTAGAER